MEARDPCCCSKQARDDLRLHSHTNFGNHVQEDKNESFPFSLNLEVTIKLIAYTAWWLKSLPKLPVIRGA
jgi:hypothetical protein